MNKLGFNKRSYSCSQLRKLEDAGLSTAQAEALTESMVTLLGHSAERMIDTYITKPELEKVSFRI